MSNRCLACLGRGVVLVPVMPETRAFFVSETERLAIGDVEVYDVRAKAWVRVSANDPRARPRHVERPCPTCRPQPPQVGLRLVRDEED